MKMFIFSLLFVLGINSTISAQGLKVFISVDMEGVTGVVNGDDVRRSGKDYDYFREVMTREANAAIAGAVAAGATEILVRDSHGAKNNILPEMLDARAKLLRGASVGPKNMMEYIDESFDAVVFIGYHARAGTPNAILEHTSNGNVIDFSVNGVSLPEGGYNALIAGLYDVPVVLVSGDKAICDQAKEILGNIETVAVKEEINNAAVHMHPESARRLIELTVKKAVLNRKEFKPYKLQAPYTMVLKVRKEKPLIEGARRTAPGESTYTSNDLLAILDAFNKMK